jgi:redox-sensing transcriptional repressor
VARPPRQVPDATVARLPLYHRALLELVRQKQLTVSSEELADLSGVNAAKVRKDLSYLGSYGTRGVGYDVENLLHEIGRELGLTENWPVVIVGIGNLGQALAAYSGFSARGFRIAALLDADPAKTGTVVAGLAVRPTDELAEIVAREQVAIGIIATPGHAAQAVADLLVTAGVRSILNFSPSVLTVPDSVAVRRVDLAVELQILSFYQHQRADRTASARGAKRVGKTSAKKPAAALVDRPARVRRRAASNDTPESFGGVLPSGKTVGP